MTDKPTEGVPEDAQQEESPLEFPSAEEVDAIVDGESSELPTESADETSELQQKVAEAERQVLLAHAELDNFRRRNLRETQEKIKYASSGLMNDILEAVDNLGRAIESYENDKNGDGSQ